MIDRTHIASMLVGNTFEEDITNVQKMIAKAVDAEREACALIALNYEAYYDKMSHWEESPQQIAELIRARGKE